MVVAILGIIAAVGIVSYSGYVEGAKKKSVENILEFLENTFEQKKNVKNAKSFVEKNFTKILFNDSLKTLISKIV